MTKYLHRAALVLTVLIALFPAAAHAYSISGEWTGVLCGIIPCSAGGGGAAGLSGYILSRVVTAFEIGFIAASILVLFFATTNMIIFSSDETALTQGRLAFLYVIVGAAVVGLARWVALAFSPAATGAQLVNTSLVNASINNIVTYIRLVLGICLTANIAIQAVRLVASQGEQEQTDKAKKRLIAGFIGVAFVMLANVIVVSLNPQLGSSSSVAIEIAGVANYLITILGFAAVLGIVIAGILLVVSVDETLRDKAKLLVKTSVISIVVALVAYALVTAFIGLA